MKKVLPFVVVVVVVVVGIFALTSKKSDAPAHTINTRTTSTTSDAMATNTVTLTNFAFSPAKITVKVGATVTWTNHDDIGHTVTADSLSTDSPNSEPFSKGQSYSFTFTKAGTYTYHCSPHPYMKGIVVVTE